MYKDVITVFVQHGEYWYPHVIHNVDVGFTTSQNASSVGDKNLDTFEVLINCRPDKKIITAQGEQIYVPPKQYAALLSPVGYITFDCNSTFVYVGAWEDNTPLSADDFDSGVYHYFRETYDSVYKIHSAAFFSLIPHFELNGK